LTGGPATDKGLCAQIQAEVTAEVERLAALAAAALGGDDDVEAVELAIRTAMLTLGGWLLQRLLAADTGHRGEWIDCGNGHRAEFISYRAKTIETVLGPITLRRAYYHCTICGRGVVPADEQLGVAGASLSPGLRKMIARVGAAVPFARAAGLLAELAGVHLNTKRVERVAEADGQTAAATIEEQAAAITARRVIPLPPPGPAPDMLYLAIDGTGVPMLPAETEGRDGKGEDGKAHTREVKLCCAFTQTTVDADGRPVRDPHSSSYLATFAPAAQFGTLMAAEARRRGADHIRQLVILGDGAAWIWNLATRHFPAATQIVDLYHAREHLHELAKLLEFMLGDHKQDWLAARRAELDAGDIAAITTAARAFPLIGTKADERDKALGYFQTNAHRMRYQHFRSLGMFVGSGTVEAGCKAVIGQRLKLSGMRWSLTGATGILTLRCQQASNRWDEIWQQPNNQTQPAKLASYGT
jgi:hypothetical protein